MIWYFETNTKCSTSRIDDTVDDRHLRRIFSRHRGLRLDVSRRSDGNLSQQCNRGIDFHTERVDLSNLENLFLFGELSWMHKPFDHDSIDGTLNCAKRHF